MTENLEIRRYNDSDIAFCSHIVFEVFPHLTRRFSHDQGSKLMRAYVESCLVVSTFCFVAIVKERIVGFLFGRTRERFGLFTFIRRLLLLSIHYLSRKYGKRAKLIPFLKPCFQEVASLKRHLPPSDGEVLLFAVTKNYQRRGIGRALMDNFVCRVQEMGNYTISVPTDERSNYLFYESYGFEKFTEYPEPLSSFFAGNKIQGFSYRLDIAGVSRNLGRSLK